uniref:Uncharacterized protein n=1 Tax=viral metagenome TaxID=1070528 RepID=A0A6M3KX65_9ZZZZ
MAEIKDKMSALIYLKRELEFPLTEWKALSAEDKEWYKEAAREEMQLKGILVEV